MPAYHVNRALQCGSNANGSTCVREQVIDANMVAEVLVTRSGTTLNESADKNHEGRDFRQRQSVSAWAAKFVSSDYRSSPVQI